MPDPPQQRTSASQLLALSLRLKAARYLAGHKAKDGRAVALTVADLATREILERNGITKNRIEDYEQMKVVDPRPMELEKIAEGLGVPPSFILEPLDVEAPIENAVARLTEATAAMRVVARRLGADIGKRDLQLSAAKDLPQAARPTGTQRT